MKKSFFILVLTLLVSSVSFASTMVYDLDQNELVSLKTAVETTFKKQCPEVESIKNYFGLNLESCLPESISKTLNVKKPTIEGPNCYNYVFSALGIMDSIREVSATESRDLFFEKGSPFCGEITESGDPKAGEVVAFGNQYSIVHTYLFLTNKYALNKNGPSSNYEWEIKLRKNIIEEWGSKSNVSKTSRYNCRPIAQNITDELTPTLNKISKYTKALSEFAVQPKHSQENINKLKEAIANLRNDITLEDVKLLTTNANDPIVKMKIYDIVSSFNSLYSLLVLYKNNTKYFDFYVGYKPYIFTYLTIIDDILTLSPQTFGFQEYLKFPELNEYCYVNKDQSRVCQLKKARL